MSTKQEGTNIVDFADRISSPPAIMLIKAMDTCFFVVDANEDFGSKDNDNDCDLTLASITLSP